MRKIIKYLLILILSIVFIPLTNVNADSTNVKTISASIDDDQITVSGTTDDGVFAVAVVVYEEDGTSLVTMGTTSVSDSNFNIVIDVSSEKNYVVKAADYDGGDWKTTTVTVPVTSKSNGGSADDDTTSVVTEKTATTKTTTKTITLANGDKKQTVSSTEFIITKKDGTILREITVKGNSDIKISGDSKFIPTGSVMEQKELTKDSEGYKAVEKAIESNPDLKLDKAKEVFAYDIDLSSAGGTEIHELDGYVEVSIPVPSTITIDENQYITVYRVNDDGSLTKCETEVKDGVITFKTDHFSTYIFALEENVIESNVEEITTDVAQEVVSTSSISNFIIPLCILLVALLVGVIIAVIKIITNNR